MRRLLIRPGAIGDFLLSLPALEFLKAEFTEVWCAEPNVPLARFADAARSIGSSGLDRLGIWKAPEVLRLFEPFDEIHSWYGAARPDFRDAVAGLPFVFHAALPSGDEHAMDYYCRQVGAPLYVPGRRNSLHILHKGRPDTRFAVVHPFASREDKRWPLESYRRLALRLGDVRWCAGPEEALPEATRISNLYDLAEWLAQARVYIGNDSGISHLAAAVGTPVVALFGPTDPLVWAPRGPAVRILRRDPMALICIGEVAEAALAIQTDSDITE